MIVAIIPAQGQSTRLPRKNMREIEGQPLLFWSIEAAKKSKSIDNIIVSTDDSQIAEYAKSQGVIAVIRGKELCGDAPVLDVYKDAIIQSGLEDITYVVAIQPDHPDRRTDIDSAIKVVLENSMSDFLTTDRFGVRHGSIRIMRCDELMKGVLAHTSGGAWIDNCVNVHTEQDLRRAEAAFIRKRRPIMLYDFALSEESNTFIILEITVDSSNQIDRLTKVVDLAKEVGFDAVTVKHKTLGKLHLKGFQDLFEYCKERDIIPLANTSDYESIDALAEIGPGAFKIASSNLTDMSLIKHISSKGKPVILSTGTSDEEGIRHAVHTVLEAENRDIALLHNLSSYPTKKNMDLRGIGALKEAFPEAIVGIFDYMPNNEGIVIPSAAVALGAKIVEKSYQLNAGQASDDPGLAIDTPSLKMMVQNIRIVEKAL